ncbi:MAG TPA: Ada metal-binding domain-containing protein [Opitutaceae bacterium]|jgi:AraC family transcriptional regulator of adaptative response / DNA-3-methyladenine glycosylase II
MTNEQMYSRFLASDPAWDGRFFTGVLTTGIYCLPSCRARKPRRENVRFFASCESARGAGLRACLKCHPDDYEKGADPVLESVEALVSEIRTDPARFADARSIVRRSGYGSTRCFELLRRHFHTTPADLLLRSRIDRSMKLIAEEGAGPSDAAAGAGFESISSFHENFRAQTGMTPTGYRSLRSGRPFSVDLPPEYPLPHLLRILGRDPQSVTERLTGSVYETSASLAGTPGIIRVEFDGGSALVSLSARREPGPAQWFAAHRVVSSILGLDQDAAAFVRLARRLGLSRLVAGRHGLRLHRTPGIFDGLIWSIIGQQINLSFACTLRRRLIENVGAPLPGGLFAVPEPGAVASLDLEELRRWQFSRKKAEYLVGVSQLVAGGGLDLDGLARMSATRAERALLAIRGLGPWSVHYVMMRALGWADCVPIGDTGVSSGLETLFDLDQRPDADATRRLMSVFSPHRSLATAHLWQINKPNP